jgi:beta-lactam-binding protein with PASTA domain
VALFKRLVLVGAAALVVVALALWFLGGSPPTRVPGVVGVSADVAKQRVLEAKLKPVMRAVDTGVRCRPGDVTHQTPHAGSVIEEGAQVRITLCPR